MISIETYFFIQNGSEISKQYIISIIFSIIIIVGMLKANAAFCSGAGFFGAARLFIFCLLFFLGDNVSITLMFLFEVIVSSSILILGFYLRTKLDSRYTVESEPEIIDSTDGISFPD
jgi:hypothetical protein